jgi:hypothetical protein
MKGGILLTVSLLRKGFLPVLFALILISGYGINLNAAGQSSDNFMIPNDVISTGGTERDSTSFIMNDTIGQASPIGISMSVSFIVHGGFWGPMAPVVPTPEPTETPILATPTVTMTPTFAPIPAVGPMGGVILLVLFGGLLALATNLKKLFRE